MGSGLHTAPVGSGWRIPPEITQKTHPSRSATGLNRKNDKPPEAQIQEDLALRGTDTSISFYKVILGRVILLFM